MIVHYSNLQKKKKKKRDVKSRLKVLDVRIFCCAQICGFSVENMCFNKVSVGSGSFIIICPNLRKFEKVIVKNHLWNLPN
jgi:hypothetical protein